MISTISVNSGAAVSHVDTAMVGSEICEDFAIGFVYETVLGCADEQNNRWYEK